MGAANRYQTTIDALSHWLSDSAKGGGLRYIYADPVVCNCLYVGDPFNAYKKEVFTRNIVNEQQLTAETYSDQWSWAGWDWGAWGPRGWW